MSIITSKIQQLDANGNVVSPSIIQGYEASNKDESGSPTYYGFLNDIGNWYIMRITSTDIDYTKGLTNYSASWTGRAGLSYAKFDVVF